MCRTLPGSASAVSGIRYLLSNEGIAHFVVDVNAVEVEPARADALADPVERQRLELRGRTVLLEQIDPLPAVAVIAVGIDVEPEMLDVVLLELVDFTEGRQHLRIEHRRLRFGTDVERDARNQRRLA